MHVTARMMCAVIVVACFATLDTAHALPAQGGDTATVVCGSKAGERVSCAADTSGGVTLVTLLGTVACDLGRTWGYDDKGVWVSDGCGAEFSIAAPKAAATFGRYTPGVGFKVADTEYGDLNIRTFTYLRYLNQLGVDATYTNAFGKTTDVQRRQDIQLNKLQVYFFGWAMSPKLRYLAYVWTSNTSLGLTSQVVVAGNLNYKFSDYVTVGGGVGGLPGTRSTEGTFPYWLSVDSRHIADEYLRPSYTTGIWVNGRVLPRLDYQAMLGNNLSQFGIDAGQLDNSLNTFAGELTWYPTTGEFGKGSGFGDFDEHAKLATRLAAHYTRSDENRQGQPTNDGFDNVQIRVSDGSVIFAPGLFAPEVQIEDATYRLFSLDGGIKYRGLSFDFEHYWRRINNFTTRGAGTLPFADLHDTGFQVQASTMVVPKQVQLYAGGSKVFGEYGNPHDVRAGGNIFPWKNETVRLNVEYIHLDRAPVGAASLPYSVGNSGPVFHTNVMLWF